MLLPKQLTVGIDQVVQNQDIRYTVIVNVSVDMSARKFTCGKGGLNDVLLTAGSSILVAS